VESFKIKESAFGLKEIARDDKLKKRIKEAIIILNSMEKFMALKKTISKKGILFIALKIIKRRNETTINQLFNNSVKQFFNNKVQSF
jgi:ribosomal protein L36